MASFGGAWIIILLFGGFLELFLFFGFVNVVHFFTQIFQSVEVVPFQFSIGIRVVF